MVRLRPEPLLQHYRRRGRRNPSLWSSLSQVIHQERLCFGQPPLIYLQLRRGWLSVRIYVSERETGRCEGAANAALRQDKNGRWEAFAVGDDTLVAASVPGTTLFYAFQHPRVILDEFDKTLLLLQMFIRYANGGRKHQRPFRMVIQLLEGLDRGLTDVEQRALSELGMKAEARSVVFTEGERDLTISELSKVYNTADPYILQQV